MRDLPPLTRGITIGALSLTGVFARSAPSSGDYLDAHPTSPVLVVEVADSSLAPDRNRKGGLYARAGVADYWIANLLGNVLEVYRDPERTAAGRWRYATVRVLKPRALVSPLAAPRARLRVAELLA
ncbi:MAG: hypothetical protein DMD83_12730 [Candidatus Rokuibacteriota bacterium]|nr:MAG: hypothetical protein DMD83_12730 [Candidatus Rokubacteria bacterium]